MITDNEYKINLRRLTFIIGWECKQETALRNEEHFLEKILTNSQYGRFGSGSFIITNNNLSQILNTSICTI